MGSRPSKVSPSMLGMRCQLDRDDIGLLTNIRFASKSPILTLTKKTSVSLGAPENGFITPQSRGRSAICNMARTPYSRAHHTSILKGNGIHSDGYATFSPSLSPVQNNEDFESQTVTLKRISSVLDDEVGSASPIRRIRQKPNSLAPKIHRTSHGVGIGSYAKQKLHLVGEQRNRFLNSSGENENGSVPSTSSAHVPSKSSEVAARILEQLEKLSPKEKSSETNLVAVREKSKSKPSMLSGPTLRSMEYVGSSKLLPDVHDDHKFGHRPGDIPPKVRDSSPQKQGKAEENDPIASVVSSGSVLNNDSAVSLKASMPSMGAADSVVYNGAQPSQKRRVYRMSAEEDYLEQDDVQCNGSAFRSLSEKKGPMEPRFMDDKLAPAEEPELVKKTTVQSSKFSPGAATVGERTSPIAVPASGETQAIAKAEGFTSSLAAFNKTKETTSVAPLFNFSSGVADKFPSLPSESIKRPESEFRSSIGLVNISAPIGSQAKSVELDKGFHVKLPNAGDINGKCGDAFSAESNGPLVSSCSPVSFSAASFCDTNQISTGSGFLFTSSTSITNFVSTSTNTSATSSGNSPFGLVQKPPSLAGPVLKFGSSVDLPTTVSAAFTTSISEVVDRRTEIEKNSNFGISSSSHSTVAAFAASSIGSCTFGPSSSVSFSTVTNLQSSLFANDSKSLVLGAGNGLQVSSGQSVSSTLLPTFNVNTSTSLGSSPCPTNIFGFCSSASSSDTSCPLSVGGRTSSLFKFGASSSAVSEGSPACSSSIAIPSIFSSGSSSSSSTVTIGSGSGATPSIFKFGGTSSASPSVINTGSSFSSVTSGISNFGGSSSAASSTINAVSSVGAPSTIFGSSWQGPKASIFGSTFTSPSPPAGFSFGAPSTASVYINAAAAMVFNSSMVASSGPISSFTTASTPASSSSSLSPAQPVFGNPPIAGGFNASPGNNDQINAEDSMVEDPAPSSAPVPVFGQPSVTGFTFGSTIPSQASPFMFAGQQNQTATQNPSPFQASGSLEFNAGGSFSLGSGGGDKSGRKIVKINRNKNRKK